MKVGESCGGRVWMLTAFEEIGSDRIPGSTSMVSADHRVSGGSTWGSEDTCTYLHIFSRLLLIAPSHGVSFSFRPRRMEPMLFLRGSLDPVRVVLESTF